MFRPLTALDRLLAAAESRLEKLQEKARAVEKEIEALRAAIARDEQTQPQATPAREKGK